MKRLSFILNGSKYEVGDVLSEQDRRFFYLGDGAPATCFNHHKFICNRTLHPSSTPHVATDSTGKILDIWRDELLRRQSLKKTLNDIKTTLEELSSGEDICSS